MVPEGWVEGKVGDLLKSLESGVSVNGEDRPLLEGEKGVLRVSAVSYGTFNPHAVKAVVAEDLPRVKTCPKAGQIIISRSNTEDLVGASAYVFEDHPDLFLPDKLWQTVPKTRANMRWLSYFLASNYSRYTLSRLATGTSGSMKNITKSELLGLNVFIPPRKEQQIIAKILTTWDEAIATAEQLLANSEQQKKALMQQLLTGKKRLPGFEGEWTYKRISDIASRVKRESDGGDYPILMIASKSGFINQHEKFSRFMAGESLKKYILLKQGEFAYNKGNSRTYQFGCIFDLEDFEKGLVPNVYVCFKLKNGCSNKFYKHLFRADYLKSQLGRLVNTGVRNNGLLNIKPSEFMKTYVPVPDLEEQEVIADLMEASAQEIEQRKRELHCLKEEKRALMQQLLTGKRRVETFEDEPATV